MTTAVRLSFRLAAVGLLLTGVVGGFRLHQQREVAQELRDQAAQAEAVLAEAQMLQRMAEQWEKADRLRRSTTVGAARRIDPYDAVAEAGLLADAAEERERLRAEAERSFAPPPPPPPPMPIPESCDEYSGNRAVGCALLLDHGFELDQMPCLDNLWTRESGWNHLASNPYTGAYGIPQALPGSKMASHGEDWATNPATQIRWGLSYISGRYGTPCDAWGFFQRNGWY